MSVSTLIKLPNHQRKEGRLVPRIKDFVSLHQSPMHFFTWPSMFWFESMPTLLIDASHIPGILCAGLILSPLAIQYVMVILLLSVRRTKLSYPSRNLSPAQAVKVNMWWQLENLGQSPGVERSPYRANKANKGNLKSPLISRGGKVKLGLFECSIERDHLFHRWEI